MTASSRTDADPAVSPVADVADTVVELVRSFQRAKARYLSVAEHDVEWSARMVLRLLAHHGPMRAGAIAECLQSDPSTVSRHVATLVKDGLIERQADPEDGRASILALTAKADDVLAEHERLRVAHFAGMLSDWNASDLSRFATMLRRFTNDFEKSSSIPLVNQHVTQPSAPPGPAERKQ
jgi:DNA-binding MarR family transcriptional regulator